MPPRPVSRQSHQGGGPMNPFCQPPALPLVERSQPPTKASNRRLNAIDGPTMINRSSSDPSHARPFRPPGADPP